MKIKITFLFICIYAFSYAQIPGYDLYSIVLKSGAENPISGISPITEEKQPADSTLDIVNWNLSFFGSPSFSSKFKGVSREVQIDSVAKKMVEIDADVYALQEVVVDSYRGNALTDLVTRMNELAGNNEYGGSYSEYHSLYWTADDPGYPAQCLAYIWKKATVSVNKDSALLKDEAGYSNFGYGRLPYMLDANVTFRGKTQRYIFINIHLKASKGYSDERANSMKLLRKLLEVNFSENNVVLLGDYNVADNPGAVGEIEDWGMYEDREGDGLTDYVHVAGDKQTGIEHTLISNELYDELAYISEWDWNVTIANTTKYSDHFARMTSLYVYEESGNVDPGNTSIFSNGDYSFTLSKSDYQIIVDYVKNDPELSKLDPSTYDDSEYYFGSSAYYTNFDIRDGNHYAGFETWQEAVKKAISLALLPAKFPNAVANDSVYHITFETYNGTQPYIAYTFNFECTKSAPNPEFEYTTRTAVFEDSMEKPISIYPNPAIDHLSISSQTTIQSIVVFDLSGSKVITINGIKGTNRTIDLDELKAGVYIVEVLTNEERSKIKFIKR